MFLLDGHHKFYDKETGKHLGLNQAMQKFIAQLGIFALSKTATDALLWSHYANGHRGVCLGFDSDLLDIKDVFIKDDIEYKDEPPYVDLFLQMIQELGEFVKPWEANNSYPPERGEEFYTKQISRLMRSNLLVKSNKWRYEEEYRLISNKSGHHDFSPSALREIITGAKISKQDLETIKNIIQHPDYSHVVIRGVEIVSGSFDFKLSELPKTKS